MRAQSGTAYQTFVRTIMSSQIRLGGVTMAFDVLHTAVERLSMAPGLRHIRESRFDRVFVSNPGLNLFRGVYASFDEALASIPVQRRQGYDCDEAATLYENWLDVFDYDYPALFWVQRSIAQGMRSVCDLGGNIGFKYLAFHKLADFPADLRWTVIDLPAIVARGRTFAQEHGVSHALCFTDDANAADGHELLFASGSLQYLPRSLPEILLSSSAKPKRIVVNITPIHPSRGFFTINSFGPGFAPYRVQQRGEFIDGIERAGYRLADEWKNLKKSLDMPFDKELCIDHYSGFCFERVSC